MHENARITQLVDIACPGL